MFLQNLLEIVLVVLDGSGGIFTGLIQGDLVKMLQLFIYCHTFHLPVVVAAYSNYNVTVHSVHSNLVKIHSISPSVMGFCPVCLGILSYT